MARGDVAAAWELLAVVQRILAMIAEGNEALSADLQWCAAPQALVQLLMLVESIAGADPVPLRKG